MLIYARSQLASSVDFMRQTSNLEMRTWAQVNFSYVSNKVLLAKVNGATLNQTEPAWGVEETCEWRALKRSYRA